MSPRGIPVIPRSKRSTTWQPKPSWKNNRALSLQAPSSSLLVETREDATDIVDALVHLCSRGCWCCQEPLPPRSMSLSPFALQTADTVTLMTQWEGGVLDIAGLLWHTSVGHFPSFDGYKQREEIDERQMEVVREKCLKIDDVRREREREREREERSCTFYII